MAQGIPADEDASCSLWDKQRNPCPLSKTQLQYHLLRNPRPVSGSDWPSHRLYPLQGIIMGKAIQMSGKTGTFSNPVAWGRGGLHQWPPMGPLTSYRFMLQFPYLSTGVFPSGSEVKESAYSAGNLQKMQVRSLDQEEPLEEGTATHSSIPAWKIPWTEEPSMATVHGVTKSRSWLSDTRTSTTICQEEYLFVRSKRNHECKTED